MNYDFVEKYRQPKRTGNIICDLNPFSKLNLMVVLGLASLIVQNYIFGFCMVAFIILVAVKAGCFKSFFSLYWKILILFGVFLFLMKAAFSPGEHVLWQYWGICVTTESIIEALNTVCMVLAFSGAFILFVKTTPMEDFTYAMEQRGASHMASFAILSSFQSIIDLGENAQIIMESQKARGIETEGNLLQRAKAYIPVMGPLILNAIASTEEKAIAMDARAFSAPTKHTALSELPEITKKERTVVILFDIAFAALIVWRVVSWLL